MATRDLSVKPGTAPRRMTPVGQRVFPDGYNLDRESVALKHLIDAEESRRHQCQHWRQWFSRFGAVLSTGSRSFFFSLPPWRAPRQGGTAFFFASAT